MNSNLYIWNKRVSQSWMALKYRKLFHLWSTHFTSYRHCAGCLWSWGLRHHFRIGPFCPAFPHCLESCLLVRASVRNIKSIATTLGRMPSPVSILSVPFSYVRIHHHCGHGNVSGNNSFATVASLNQILRGVINRDGTLRGFSGGECKRKS